MTAQNPSVAARAHMAVPLWMLGRADQALQSSQRALRCARDLTHPFSIAYALLSNALVHSFRGEPTLAFEMATELIALCRDHGFSQLWRGSAISVLGWAKQKQNRSADGIADMRVGIAEIRESGTELVVPYYLSLLAAAYCGCGQIDDGLAALEDGVAVVERTSERLWEAELHRQQGELRRCIDSRDRAGEAEERFGIAVATARRQGAVALELRAVTSLARLWRAQDKTPQAHDLVTGAIDRFQEGLSTADLLEAKAILVRAS